MATHRPLLNRSSQSAAMTAIWRVLTKLRSHGANGVRPKTLARELGFDVLDVKLALHYLAAHSSAAYVSGTGAYRVTNGHGYCATLGINTFEEPDAETVERAYIHQLENLNWARQRGLDRAAERGAA